MIQIANLNVPMSMDKARYTRNHGFHQFSHLSDVYVVEEMAVPEDASHSRLRILPVRHCCQVPKLLRGHITMSPTILATCEALSLKPSGCKSSERIYLTDPLTCFVILRQWENRIEQARYVGWTIRKRTRLLLSDIPKKNPVLMRRQYNLQCTVHPCFIKSHHSFGFAASMVGRSKSRTSPAASLRKKLIRSLPSPLLTMLN